MTCIALELKVPPPVVALATALLMWIAARDAPLLDWPFAVRTPTAVALAAAGLLLGIAAIRTFSRAGTTVNPMAPQKAAVLVTHGVYRFTRNPMYVSLLLYLAGWAVYLAAWPAALGLPLFMLYMTRWQIVPEERALAARFGEAFLAYARSVRRWF